MIEHTHISAFVACDRIIEEAGTGKKTIVGMFRNFNFQTLPGRFGAPWFLFAQLLEVDPGSHEVTINIVHDQTTGVVFAAQFSIPEDHPPNLDVVIPAQGTEFHKTGSHVVTLNIDGTQAAYFILNVTLLSQQQGG